MVDTEVRAQQTQAGTVKQLLEVGHMVESQVMEGEESWARAETLSDHLQPSVGGGNTHALIVTICEDEDMKIGLLLI